MKTAGVFIKSVLFHFQYRVFRVRGYPFCLTVDSIRAPNTLTRLVSCLSEYLISHHNGWVLNILRQSENPAHFCSKWPRVCGSRKYCNSVSSLFFLFLFSTQWFLIISKYTKECNTKTHKRSWREIREALWYSQEGDIMISRYQEIYTWWHVLWHKKFGTFSLYVECSKQVFLDISFDVRLKTTITEDSEMQWNKKRIS